VHTLKRLVFISLSLLLLLILIPGCITVRAPAPNPIPPAGTPPVILEFSSNPSAINSGSPSTLFWTVTGATLVSIDQGIGQVDFVGIKVVSPTTSTVYTISATNSAGTVTGSAVTTVNAAPLPPAPIQLTGITVGVIPDESGSMVKSGRTYTRLPAICVGDNGADLASRAFLSFDISWIPSNALIDEVVLNLGGYTSTGLPTYTDPVYGPNYGNFGALEIYRYQYGTYEGLDTLAYNGQGELLASGKITSYPISPWTLAIKDPASGKSSVQGLIIAGQPRFQLRIQFFTSTNWNGVADTLCFDRATLTVKYHLP
jgi:hypothetical protein